MAESTVPDIDRLVHAIPEGWSRARIDGQDWGVTRTTKVGGRSVSVYAELLGGNDMVSANVWLTKDGPILKPCEMPAAKVLDFLDAAATVYTDRLQENDHAER